MTALEFTIVVWAISALAGFLGALTGLGGGVVVVPALTLALGVDIKYAIGASLVSVIATSSGAAAAYVREGFSNIRIGMFLEIATTIGAVCGALLAPHIGTHAIAIIFGLVLLQSAYQTVSRASRGPRPSDPVRQTWQQAAPGRLVSRRGRRYARVWRAPRARRIRPDVRRRRALRTARHRFRRRQGHRHGSRHGNPIQGFHHHQQLHDRSYRRGQRRRLFEPRLHRSAGSHAGDAGRAGRRISRLQGF